MSSVGIVLGLTAALSWGLADYFAAVASAGPGPSGSCSGSTSSPSRSLRSFVVGTGETLSDVSGGDLAWFLFLGLLGALSYSASTGRSQSARSRS